MTLFILLAGLTQDFGLTFGPMSHQHALILLNFRIRTQTSQIRRHNDSQTQHRALMFLEKKLKTLEEFRRPSRETISVTTLFMFGCLLCIILFTLRANDGVQYLQMVILMLQLNHFTKLTHRIPQIL